MAKRGLTMLALALAAGACTEGTEGPTTVVTVRTVDELDAPVAGVTVIGNDAAGGQVDQQVTDAAGEAALAVPAGGSITTHDANPAAPPDLVTHAWTTVLGVELGDVILVRVARGAAVDRLVEVIAPPLPAGATAYQVSAPCAGSDTGGPGDPARLWLDLRCPDHGPMVVTALAADQVTVVAYLELADVAFAPATITVSGAWTAPARAYEVMLTGVGASGAQVSRAALSGGYPVHWSAPAMTLEVPAQHGGGPRPAIGDSALYQVTTGAGDFCDRRSQAHLEARAADVDRFELDLGALLPPITDVALADRQVSWTGGGGAAASGVSVYLTAALGSFDVVGQARTWTVVAPPGVTTVTMPDTGFVWPAGQAAGDRVTAIGVTAIASTHWASYADVRQRSAEDPRVIAGDFVTRRSSISRQYAYLGCPFGP